MARDMQARSRLQRRPIIWRLSMIMLLAAVLAAGCGFGLNAESAPEQTSSTVRSSLVPDGRVDGDPSPDPPDPPDRQPLAEVTAPPGLEVELLASPPVTLGERWPQLATFGYYGRPARSFEQYQLPSFVVEAGSGPPPADSVVADLKIQVVDLNWGIDSSGLLVTVDGPAETIAQVEPELAASTRWLATGETWVAAMYRGGLASGFEIDDLAEHVEWVMRPTEACELSDRACPFGAAVAFPPPPPTLAVSGGVIDGDVPFEILEVVGSTEQGAPVSITTFGGSISWIEDGTLYGGWVGIDTGPPEDRGPATAAHVLGSLAFVVEPSPSGGEVVALRYCCDEGGATVWSVPIGWTVEELVMVGIFGTEHYQLVITGRLDDGSSRTVALPFDPRILNGPVWSSLADGGGLLGADVDAASLSPLHGDDVAWTLLGRHRAGITVVEERADGWYLLELGFDGRFGEPRELLRSSHPVLSYSLDFGAQHLALVVDGPEGPVTMWANNGSIVEIGRGPASVGWLGTHPRWAED